MTPWDWYFVLFLKYVYVSDYLLVRAAGEIVSNEFSCAFEDAQ
jgi:hypothetical protein